MKILNLTNSETSDIRFEVSSFPDGQQQVNIISILTWDGNGDGGVYYYQTELINIPKEVEVKSRLNNFRDLELIICVVASLRELGVDKIHLSVPYFMGARSDRKFEYGSNNYLKHVICPIINSLKLASVTVLDAHSDVLEACLNNYKKIDNVELVLWAMKDIGFSTARNMSDFLIVSPDAGAMKKIYNVTERIGYKGDIVIASKHRDVNGKITHTEVPLLNRHYDKDIIIIDDICDGGRTFIEIAKRIMDQCPMNYKIPKIYLIITHGIFSQGFEELDKHFDGIYCTNSYRDITSKDLRIYEGGYNQYSVDVKQLNVF